MLGMVVQYIQPNAATLITYALGSHEVEMVSTDSCALGSLHFAGALYSNLGGEHSRDRKVAFVENYAVGRRGAMFIEFADVVEVNYSRFKSNEGSLGGAAYIVAAEDKQTIFSECVFENNEAGDGGAVYLNTGPGVDIFTASVFRNNFAGELPGVTGRFEIDQPHLIVAISGKNSGWGLWRSVLWRLQRSINRLQRRLRNKKVIEWASPPQWWIGHVWS